MYILVSCTYDEMIMVIDGLHSCGWLSTNKNVNGTAKFDYIKSENIMKINYFVYFLRSSRKNERIEQREKKTR